MKNSIILCIMVVVLGSFNLTAQVKSVSIQASGLTCSMCNNAINKALKTIPYVVSIKSDIQHAIFELEIKSGSTVDFDELRNTVEDAGFFVASMTVLMRVHAIDIIPDKHIELGSTYFHFLNTSTKAASGDIKLKILDKGFIPDKEWKKNKNLSKSACYQSGKTASCCTILGFLPGKRVYHVSS